jgi:glutamate-5-semialdehyde dehydrogenase
LLLLPLNQVCELSIEALVNLTNAGNAAILKGGKESLKTQAVLKKVIQAALSTTAVPADFIQTVESRSEIAELLKQSHLIDLVIPRGSNSLVKSIQESTKIPVMGHADGICSIFVDASANVDKAVRVILDAKVRNQIGRLNDSSHSP